MNSHDLIPAIDVHGHYGQYLGEAGDEFTDNFYSGDATEVVRRASAVNIVVTIVSPLTALKPRFHADAIAGNSEAARVVAATPGLKQYVVINPLQPETYAQANDLLIQPQCVGIKIHPEEHGYPIREYARPIFEFAARHRAILLTHSSEKNSLAADFIPWANAFPEVRLILAHIGCGWDGDLTHQVRAIQQSRQGNVFADTSSARSITPGLIEWAVREVGGDHVLFGTDTPLYHAAVQRARIDHADLPVDARRRILWENAVGLFGPSLFVEPFQADQVGGATGSGTV
ncbi:MAG TPA: amidohydrolase family protein [Planctomycetaceae bacterium]|jgi:predicted TIM-barrel fold metal-dependent hydrolase|nr:amidohydrolase family protein [Planctomycetaceae bacterium]